MAGTLDIESASTAVSGSGLQQVKEDLRIKLLQEAVQVLENGKGEIYIQLQAAWSGQDEHNFEKNFDAMITEVEQALQNYHDQISQTIDKIDSDWQNFQSTHVS